jgi:hypothetical protein
LSYAHIFITYFLVTKQKKKQRNTKNKEKRKNKETQKQSKNKKTKKTKNKAKRKTLSFILGEMYTVFKYKQCLLKMN